MDVAVSLSTSEQLENAIRFRLEGIVPYLSHWPAALALLAQPCAAPYSIISAVNAIDEIWHYCGDKSTDVSRHEQIAQRPGRVGAPCIRLPACNAWLTVLPWV